MDKKIGIVTWFKNGNYGGTLQAYALQKTIESLGFDCEFIDFCPEAKSFSHKTIRLLKDVAISIYKPRLYQSRKQIYKFVKDNLKVSPPYYTYNQLKETADKRYFAAICGSDQIWSNAGGEINPLYYLTFIDKEKRIAYAPSIGYNNISPEISDVFTDYVNDIKYLSVREKHGANLIKEATGRNAQVVIDPSLLLTKRQWEKEIQKFGKKLYQGKRYIFCYFLGKNPDYVKYALKLAEFTQCTLVAVESKHAPLNSVKRILADPIDFLCLINNAEYILTDSFHGVALSINFGKQFATFKRFKDNDPICQNSRIYNILEKTHLENRLITTETPMSFFTKEITDYELADGLLTEERKSSLDYLKNAINAVANLNNCE